ncbi:MAG: tetratricopeptide repeat protein [Clostridia bacterium]|nr:tetratricopeptide repeat protein [Clostridia bacterium]
MGKGQMKTAARKTGASKKDNEKYINVFGKYNVSRKFVFAGIILFLVLMVWVAHTPSLSSGALTLDDDEYLINNPLVQNPGMDSAMRFITEVLSPSTVRGYYQPLAMISLMMDYGMGGRAEDLTVFHVTNLLLHTLNTIFIFIFLYFLFRKVWAGLLSAVVFGVHPMFVESISWISERKTLLSTFFVLLALVFYVLYVGGNKKRYYVLTLLAYIFSLLSKPTSTTLPVLLLILDFWPLGRLSLKSVVEKIPLFIICGISAGITYYSQGSTFGVNVPDQTSLLYIPLILCHNIVFYLKNFLWPLQLSSHYSFSEPINLQNSVYLIGVLGTVSLITALLISLRYTKAFFSGWLFFFAAIFPTMGIIGFSNAIAADKYAYFPVLGFILIIGFSIGSLWEKGQKVKAIPLGRLTGIILVSIVSLASIIGTRGYHGNWKDTETLFAHMLESTPNSSTLNYNLGLSLSKQGKIDPAILRYREAIRLKPDYAEAYSNLGGLLFQKDLTEEAVKMLKKAIELRKDYTEAYGNLGLVYDKMGKQDRAAEYYKKAIELEPGNDKGYFNYALMLLRQKNYNEAIKELNKALECSPDNSEIYYRIGYAFSSQNKFNEAVGYLKKAIEIQPDHIYARKSLARIYGQNGNMDAVINECYEILRINPEDEETKEILNQLTKQP